MVECSTCGKEIDEKTAIQLTIRGKPSFFCDETCLNYSTPIKTITHRILSKVVLNKTFGEFIAIVTGIGGIAYTLQGTAHRALTLDTVSAIATITAFIGGIEHLRSLREHNLLKKAVLYIGIGVLITIAIIVWYFGFRLNQI